MAKIGKAKILSEAEFNVLLDVAKVGRFTSRNIAMLYCSFGLGLRVKEIASLSIEDVADAEYNLLDEICLKRARATGKKQHHAYLTNKKVYNALTEHLISMAGDDRKNPFFQTQRKKAFTPNALQKWFRLMYDNAGIMDASSHSGRRTFITRLIQHGVGIKAISCLAGHASIATTAIYADDNSDCLRRIANLAVF